VSINIKSENYEGRFFVRPDESKWKQWALRPAKPAAAPLGEWPKWIVAPAGWSHHNRPFREFYLDDQARRWGGKDVLYCVVTSAADEAALYAEFDKKEFLR
jgi:hypothetical protein